MTLHARSTNSRPGCTTTVRHRGSAMIEAVLALPLIMLILVLLFFMGRGMVRVQRARMMDRFEAWRLVNHMYFNEPDSSCHVTDGIWLYATEVPIGPRSSDAERNAQLNAFHYGGRATDIHTTSGLVRHPHQAATDFLDMVSVSSSAYQFTDEIFSYLPVARTAAFATEHPQGSSDFWQRFNNQIRHGSAESEHVWAAVNGWREIRISHDALSSWGFSFVEVIDPSTRPQQQLGRILHVRQGSTGVESFWRADFIAIDSDGFRIWRRRWPDADIARPARNTFLMDIDERLRALDPHADFSGRDYHRQNLAGAITGLYMDNDGSYAGFYGYAGPTVYAYQHWCGN